MLKYKVGRGKRKKVYFFFFIVFPLTGKLARYKQHSTQGSPQIQGLVYVTPLGPHPSKEKDSH